MSFNLTEQQKKTIRINHLNRCIEWWRQYRADTKEPSFKLNADVEIAALEKQINAISTNILP